MLEKMTRNWWMFAVRGLIAIVFGVVALIIGLFVDRDRHRRVIWCGLGAGVVVHALYVAGFTAHYTFWAWYYVSGVLAAGKWLSITSSQRSAHTVSPVT